MLDLAVGVVSSWGCGTGAKPKTHCVLDAKSSVSGIGIEAQGEVGGLTSMDLRCAMSNLCGWAVAVGVVDQWTPDILVRRG